MNKSINDLYHEYKKGVNTYEIEKELYKHAKKLGYNIYWKGFDKYINKEEADSLIGFSLSNALNKYDINNTETKFSSYLSTSVYKNFCNEIRRYKKDIDNGLCFFNDVVSIDKDGNDITIGDLIGEDDKDLELISKYNGIIDSVVKISIEGYNPNKSAHRRKFDRNKKVLLLVIKGYSEREIGQIMGYTGGRMVSKIKYTIRRAAEQKALEWKN